MRTPLWFGALLAPSLAFATTNPDYTDTSSSGYLVSPHSVELESGVRYQDAFTAPTVLKYAVGTIVEPRINWDMAGVFRETAGLGAGAKIAFVQDKNIGFSGWLHTNVPLSAGESWEGTARALFSWRRDGFSARLNTGLDFEGGRGGGGVDFAGVPVSLMGWSRFTPELSGYLEGSMRLEPAPTSWMAEAGLAWNVADSFVVNAGGGLDIDAMKPFIQVGMVANFGSVGRAKPQ